MFAAYMAVDKKCKNCGCDFSVRNYRTNTAVFCSYRCSGTYRKTEQYKDKQLTIQKSCEVCEKTFFVDDKWSKRGKKTCSNECRNKLQGLHLQQYPKSHPIPKEKLLPKHKKICVICGNKFEIPRNRGIRQQTCGKKCGWVLSGKNNMYNITREEFKSAIDKSKTTYELCDILKCSIYTVMRRSKEFNIPYLKVSPEKLRSDGYHNYNNKKNHRRIYEEYHNIKLISKQAVHHIDGDKANNNIYNLILADTVSEHMKMHGSIQKVAFELFKDGLIGFDVKTKSYYKK